ncbi:DUF4190 domain-containing protein [Gordonia alkanivorans]|uniref:DUF4190 domain-containing protein n=1 Tax=Gordonia alkanivorans TaxID=84096 RepID=UPI0005A9459F|nr:DUF4190 domain-containing protein [Gordonia alkanivorans]MDH3021428.1 DUF4190 domain-containing protein [Gordonia alkanivorans]MDH3050957.1 DUF4190 domain-containing protein [Gordonia alkanivorans]MDJ0009096.1 DUF4190 domain-containing protein [Gordonia alkanivorans]MDJ0098994.1 DUF4190 domain-containing protein [Gordonia alkanivorans]MDJ0494671.1 DUF4190 domain-containing protein [Gordonia alkanivorans]
MSYPPGQGSGQGQDDWGTVPSSGSSGGPQSGGSGPNLSKGDQGQSSPDYAPTEFAQTYQPGPSSDPQGQNPYGQNPYGQNPYEQNPYGQPQGQDPYNPNPYGQPPGANYGQYGDPYQAGQAPAYGSAAYGTQNPYGSAPYGGYGYGAPQTSTNGKAIGALICGIVALVMLAACFPLALPLGIAGVVLGFMARREVEQSAGNQTGTGMGLAGIITGGLGILGAVIATVLIIILIAAGNSMDSVYYY